eukprot:COSAG03_NODE_3483_length_1987_cov_2.534958_1_plen_173_part_00
MCAARGLLVVLPTFSVSCMPSANKTRDGHATHARRRASLHRFIPTAPYAPPHASARCCLRCCDPSSRPKVHRPPPPVQRVRKKFIRPAGRSHFGPRGRAEWAEWRMHRQKATAGAGPLRTRIVKRSSSYSTDKTVGHTVRSIQRTRALATSPSPNGNRYPVTNFHPPPCEPS